MAAFTKILAMIQTLIIMLCPCLNYSVRSEEDIKLNAAIISDVHIDTRLPCGKALLKKAFKDMNGCKTPIDAAIVTGDLTNYGDKESIVDYFKIFSDTSNAVAKISAMGNHDIGHVRDLGLTNQEARDWFLEKQNEYMGTSFEKNYYSYDVNGYRFIVLCDESEDNWDTFEMYDEQIAWLDSQLADATKDGLPAFVICHEPVEGVNGQPIVWDDGAMDSDSSTKIKAVMEKYSNVFFISGHMHAGINGELTEKVLGFKCVETLNDVTYVTLPTYLLVNRFGIPWNGMGFQMEVYGEKVLFRARSFISSRWYSAYEFEVPIV